MALFLLQLTCHVSFQGRMFFTRDNLWPLLSVRRQMVSAIEQEFVSDQDERKFLKIPELTGCARSDIKP